MLRWALTGEDAGKVTTKGNAVHTSTSLYETGRETVLGRADRINNVYDLESNGYEWTAESNYSTVRSARGGSYRGSYYPSERSKSWWPTLSSDEYCSRAILYVK